MELKKKTVLLLALVLAAALALRFHNLGEAHSLHQDEAVSGYDAYSVLLTGRDHWGDFMPVVFREFGQYNNQLQSYLTVPFVALFGLNEFSARAPWALLGALLALAAFLIARELDGEAAGLLAAAFAAVSPWMLFTSRMAVGSNLGHVFTAFGIACFFIALRRPRFFFAAALFFGLAANTYGLALAFIPLFLTGAFVLFRKQLLQEGNRKTVFASLALLMVLLAPLAVAHFTKAETNYYFSALATFNESNWANEKSFTSFQERFWGALGNYLSPVFWFDEDNRLDYDNYGYNGFLPAWLAALVALGVVVCTNRARRDARYRLLLWWVVAAAIAAALFIPSPVARRFNVASPAFETIAAIGAVLAVNWLRKKRKSEGVKKIVFLTLAVTAVWAVASTADFVRYLYDEVPLEANTYPYYGFGWKQAVEFAQAHPEYDKVIATTNTRSSTMAYVYFLFYWKYPPTEFQLQRHSKEVGRHNWVVVKAVGERVVFCKPDSCEAAAKSSKPLYVLNTTELPELKTLKVIADGNGFAFLRLAEKNL